MAYYDYQQVPLHVADEAFAAFIQNQAGKNILDLPSVLIQHCDAWCAEHGALSEHDHRVAVIQKLQAYIHATFADELSELMRSNIVAFRQQQEIRARLHERRN